MNDSKTEYMKLNRRDRTYRHGESMNVDGHIIHRVPQFKYLGHLLTQDNGLKVEVQKGYNWPTTAILVWEPC